MALSLPICIHTYLMTRVFGTLSKAQGGVATGSYRIVGCGIVTSAVIMCRMLSLTFLANKTTAFQAKASTLCTDSSSYYMSCLVPLPANLLVRLIIAEAS